MADAAVDDRHRHGQIGEVVGRRGERVTAEHGEVGPVALRTRPANRSSPVPYAAQAEYPGECLSGSGRLLLAHRGPVPLPGRTP